MGISKAPGTQTTSMLPAPTPCSRSASTAPSSRRVEMMSLNRETTMPTRIPVASRLPVCTVAPSIAAPARPASASYRVDGIVEIEAVAQLLLLDPKVALVVRVRRDHQWDLIGHLQPVAAQPVILLRVVGEHHHPLDTDVGENLGADTVVTLVDGEPEAHVRLHRVKPAILQGIGAQL